MTNSKDTKNRILDVALDIFSSKGYHETRLDEIVQEAHVSKGSIYFHFPNKEKLFMALVDQFADLIERRTIAAIADENEGIKRVQIALQTVLEIFGKYRRPTKLLLIQAVGLGKIFEQKRLEITDRFAAMIQKYLEEAIALHEIEPINTAIVAHAWMGAIYNVVIQWVYTGEPSHDEILETLVPLLLGSVGHHVER